MTEPQVNERPDRRRRKVLVVGGIALALLFGASFAANIDINSGQEVEFGQGIEQILACDSVAAGAVDPGVIVTLTSADPAPVDLSGGTLQFDVDGLIISDIDENCLGKILTAGLYDDAGTLLDQVVFELDGEDLTSPPYRAAAIAGDGTVGCAPGGMPPSLPDGSDFVPGEDCFPVADSGLALGVNAQDVSYVALETSDPAA